MSGSTADKNQRNSPKNHAISKRLPNKMGKAHTVLQSKMQASQLNDIIFLRVPTSKLKALCFTFTLVAESQ